MFESKLSLGGSAFGGCFVPMSQEATNDIVKSAIDHGVNYIDTSPYYGGTTAETALGNALRGIPRDRFMISTKVR